MAEEIDEEVRQIIDKAYQTTRKVLTDNRDKLDAVVVAVLEAETLEGDILTAILTGKPRDEGTPDQTPGEPPAPKESGEQKKSVSPPKPGLAWEPQSRLEYDPK